MTEQIKILETAELHDGTYVTVYEEGGFRLMSISKSLMHTGLKQGRMHLSDTGPGLESPYMANSLAGLHWHPRPQKVAILGLGTGDIPRFLRDAYLETEIIIVEHAQEIIDLAKKYFRLESPGTYNYHCHDYMVWLNRSVVRNLDLLIVDVFTNQSLIESMCNSEFYQLCQDRLQVEGVLTINLVGTEEQIKACFEAARDVFGYLYRIPVFDKCCVLAAANIPTPLLVDQQVFILKEDGLNQIPIQKLKELYWTVQKYLDDWIAIRPDDEEGPPELQALWDAYYVCDEYVRASHRLEK